MARAQVYKGAVAEAHDTTDVLMPPRDAQGAVGEAHVTQGGAIARE